MTYLLYILILFVLINLFFRLATRFNIVDEPLDRSSHLRPVIRGAGVIIPLGILLWFAWSGFQYPWFLTGLLLISFISFLDDLSHVLRWIRLLTQLLAMSLLMMQLGLTPLPWWAWVLVLFMASGIFNAFNFMDGINGITAAYSLSALFGLWIVNNYQCHFVYNDLIFAAILAIVVFGFYNFRSHARCFAGDVGPIAVSFILVFLTAKLIITSGNICYSMFLCIYGVDTFFTIVKRFIRGENIFEPHRQHLYQVLTNEKGISQLKISSAYAIVQLIINFIIIALIYRWSYFYITLLSTMIIVLSSACYLWIKSGLLEN